MEALNDFHQRLNTVAMVPDAWLRRNHREHPLVCHVNTIIGLCLSRRLDAVPVFVGRARQHIAAQPERPESAAYYRLVGEYLSAVSSLVEHQHAPPA